MDTFNRNDVELLEREAAYQGFVQVSRLRLRHRLFSGGWSDTVSRELVQRKDAVGVLLYDADLDAVGLVEQFRVGVYGSQRAAQQSASPWLLELVAGLIDRDEEPPAQVAERETQEEAGLQVQALERIGQYYSSPGASNEYFYLFAGKVDLSQAGGVHGLAEESEDIRLHVVPASQFQQLLDDGRISNAHTLIAAQWLQLNHASLQQRWASASGSG